ncbi:hypothetical protein JTE90_025194 [Oedothorax gibbosus]|uniref:Uncharacterized protein n=1 Tax=Oedothorax gibbosus TaxID=931172 RepID=A0AAV6UCH4_9ARAC|nr:hypothetical protein JTE90_025194 [Oedothorax gibbosus]
MRLRWEHCIQCEENLSVRRSFPSFPNGRSPSRLIGLRDIGIVSMGTSASEQMVTMATGSERKYLPFLSRSPGDYGRRGTHGPY